MKMTLTIISVTLILAIALSFYSFEIREEIVIEAKADRVWSTITKMDQYHFWNSQLDYLGGEVKLGSVISLRLSADGADPYSFTPTINHWESEKKFGWIARTGLPRIFDGEHLFELEQLRDGSTHLVNREIYSGFLAFFIQQTAMMKNAPEGFEKMNEELRRYILSTH